MKSQQWFRMKAEGDTAEIHIIDFIGDWMDDYFGAGVTARQFVQDLSQLPESVKDIRVHINSPGGDVFGAVNIANALREQRASKGRRVETVVDGLAASAATLVMMAGDPVRVADNALIMIHNPWTIALGNAAEMRRNADLLDQVRDTIVATYQWKAELSDKELIKLMDAETWMDADEAIAHGFADKKVAGPKAAASIDGPRFKLLKLAVPARYADRVAELLRADEEGGGPAGRTEVPPAQDPPETAPPGPPGPAEPEAVVTACAEAGLDLAFAREMIDRGATPDQVTSAASEERTRRESERSRREEIESLCQQFKVPDLALDLVSGGTSAAAARSIVAKVTALVDRVEVDAGLTPDGAAGPGGKKKAVNLNPTEIFARRNGARD